MKAETARQRAENFLRICDQFRLGDLVTESSHPITTDLSDVAARDTSAALDLLFQVDGDVVETYREWVQSERSNDISRRVAECILAGGRVFFTGCGATGRLSILLDSIWRDFWQRSNPPSHEMENRTVSLMAGGDFALIKSVEGFEDITEFGKRQIEDAGVGPGDVVFAITEGGETSWVIGTAWKALENGAKVYFVYNNPDDILCERVTRSREVIDEPRIEKINLTTGPMAITGSTRMQATSIQFCVLITIMEMALRKVLNSTNSESDAEISSIPNQFLKDLEQMHQTLRSKALLDRLAGLVEMEESIYRRGGLINYFADDLGVDVLTDTTERSPTFCIPPFSKFDDPGAAQSWAFLFLPYPSTEQAWERLLKRKPKPVEWDECQVRTMVGDDDARSRYEVIKRISLGEIHRFKIGLDGLDYRPLSSRDGAIGVAYTREAAEVSSYLAAARDAGAAAGLITVGTEESPIALPSGIQSVHLSIPKTEYLLNGIARIGIKMLMNALSTCIMVRLGRVMGNYMIYVVASNLKLIDRATRYISRLTGLAYEDACQLLFEVVEYVEPRMKSDKAYPPVVGMAVMRARHGVGNEEAEAMLRSM